MKFAKELTAVVAAVGLTCSLLGNAHAATQFVLNGNFETVTSNSAGNNPIAAGSSGQLGSSNAYSAANWTIAPVTSGQSNYTFIFTSGSGDTSSGLKLWGPNDGSSNGLPSSSPAGGNFVAQDADYPGHNAYIEQQITGLTPGGTYAVNFDWALGQQSGFTGTVDLTALWQVSFSATQSGASTAQFYTNSAQISPKGFSGWQQASGNLTATSSTEWLRFFSTGSPAVPPFALLDGVSMVATPEPSSIATMLAGALCLTGIVLFRKRSRKSGTC